MITKIVNWLTWLQEGDPSIVYQTAKYLGGSSEDELRELRARISVGGFGKAFMDLQRPDGHWGDGFYQHKWVSSHYTMLDLRYLEIESTPEIHKALEAVLRDNTSSFGAISCNANIDSVDLCVNGMFLNYACFFGMEEEPLKPVVDYILSLQMPDGGYNCQSPRSGAVHSSLHSTISVLEGFLEYERAGHTYRIDEVRQQVAEAREFVLMHRFYQSDKTGKMIHKSMTMLSFPSRWKYDFLRGLLYFADAGLPYDPRMADAIDLLRYKQRKDGLWPVQAKHPGQVHFDMEKTGGPSRFNTLRAIRVLSTYHKEAKFFAIS